MSIRRLPIPVLALLLGSAPWTRAEAGELLLGTDENGVITITDSPSAVPGFEARLPVPAPRPPPAAPRGYSAAMDRFDQLIAAAADRHGLAPALLKAVCVVESRMNPRAVSPQGAQGLMQLMPRTARALGVDDPFDPAQALEGGSRYLARQLQVFGTVEMALAAYNAGPAALRAAGGIAPSGETRRFVDKVLRTYDYFLEVHPLGVAVEPES